MKLQVYESSFEFDARSFMLRARQDPELKEDLINQTHFLPSTASLSERAYCHFKHMTPPLCPVCGKPRKFHKFNKGYFATCGDNACKSKLMGDCNKPGRKDYKVIQEKMQSTYLKEHGVDHNMKDPLFLSKRFHDKFASRLKDLNYDVISFNDDLTITFKCNKCGHIFKSVSRDTITYHWKYKVPFCPNCNDTIYNQKSSFEREVYMFLKSLGYENVKCNSRPKSGDVRYEFDFIIEDKKLAIECNGIYWHSCLFCDKHYHINKKKFAESLGYDLVMIWEDDWKNKRHIVISRLKHKLGLDEEKIYARKCIMKEVSYQDAKVFLEDNHLQGDCKSSYRQGLYYNDELVMLAAYGKTRGMISKEKSDAGCYELLRLCSKRDMNIIGGFGKLMNGFKLGKLISYIDLSWSKLEGNSYQKVGFRLDKWTGADYWWTINNKRCNRLNFTKGKLVKLGYDVNKTEDEIMVEDMKALKIYGPGNLKMVMQK